MQREIKKKKAREAILISDKIDFKIKNIIRDKEENITRRYNNCKYICTQHRSTAICKTNANKYERGN